MALIGATTPLDLLRDYRKRIIAAWLIREVSHVKRLEREARQAQQAA